MYTESKQIKNNRNTKIFMDSLATDTKNDLSKIINKNINILVWQRKVSQTLIKESESIINQNPKLALSEIVSPEDTKYILINQLDSLNELSNIIDDISSIVEIFCNLFGIERAWLRLDAIDSPMCPRFHTDNVKCRLVTTYYGPGTQWLPNHLADTTKLGAGNEGLLDKDSGLYFDEESIKQLNVGDIALLKGEGWEGNKGKGLIHRSPHSNQIYRRLYMTIDFVELYFKIYENQFENLT